MRRNDIDCQILPEISHVLSNIRKPRIASQTSPPGAPIKSTEHDVIRWLDRGGKASGDDDALQLDSIDDQRFASHAEAACLVQKNESRSSGMFDVNDQREFSNPSRGSAAWALREAFANVRVKHECISRRQRAHANSVRLSRRLTHCSELSARGWGSRCREIVFVEFDEAGEVLHKFGGQFLFAKHAGSDR